MLGYVPSLVGIINVTFINPFVYRGLMLKGRMRKNEEDSMKNHAYFILPG